MRYILGVVGFIILAIVAVVLFTAVITDRSPRQQAGESQLDLTEYVDEPAEFIFNTQGPIVGEEDFQAVRITVTPSNRKIEVLRGYDETVVSERSYANTQSAYNVFVHALEKGGFARERDNNDQSVVGVCPLGNRTIYQIRHDDENVIDLWSSSCGRRSGSFGGDASMTRQLFRNQVPDYAELTRGVSL